MAQWGKALTMATLNLDPWNILKSFSRLPCTCNPSVPNSYLGEGDRGIAWKLVAWSTTKWYKQQDRPFLKARQKVRTNFQKLSSRMSWLVKVFAA